MKRRDLISGLLGIAMALLCGSAAAQPTMAKIAVLIHGTERALAGRLPALREGLRELGYVEGRNYRLDVRFSENQLDRLPSLARDLVAGRPDIAIGSPMVASEAFFLETRTIPIVMASGAGAQRLGLIASLARPGGNVTGAINQLEELAAKQLEILREIAPRAKRVMALSSGHSIVEKETRESLRAAAKSLGIQLIEAWATKPEEIAVASSRCERERCEAMVVMLDPTLLNFRAEVVGIAARRRIPAVYPTLEYADDGGLVAYSTSVDAIFRRVAVYVNKILKGAKPGDLPVERPTKFELVVNLKTAKALGLNVPQTVLFRADRVIE